MKKIALTINIFVLLISLVGGVMLAQQYLISKNTPTTNTIETNNSANEGIYMDMAGWESDHNPAGIAPYAEVIVIAKITHIGKSKWNTPDGKRPADWVFFNVHEVAIHTPFSFEVKKVIKGDITEGETHQFAVIGGTVGADVLNASNVDIYGDLQVGDEAILFLGQARGNMAYVAPYTYGDALRLEGRQAIAGCKQSRIANKCNHVFNLSNYLNQIEQAKAK